MSRTKGRSFSSLNYLYLSVLFIHLVYTHFLWCPFSSYLTPYDPHTYTQPLETRNDKDGNTGDVLEDRTFSEEKDEVGSNERGKRPLLWPTSGVWHQDYFLYITRRNSWNQTTNRGTSSVLRTGVSRLRVKPRSVHGFNESLIHRLRFVVFSPFFFNHRLQVSSSVTGSLVSLFYFKIFVGFDFTYCLFFSIRSVCLKLYVYWSRGLFFLINFSVCFLPPNPYSLMHHPCYM